MLLQVRCFSELSNPYALYHLLGRHSSKTLKASQVLPCAFEEHQQERKACFTLLVWPEMELRLSKEIIGFGEEAMLVQPAFAEGNPLKGR